MEQASNHDVEPYQDTFRSESQSVIVKCSLMVYEHLGSAVVHRESSAIEILPMACASSTASPMQIQINVPLKSSNQIMHDIITHKELPLQIHEALDNKEQLEDKGHDETTSGIFKAIAMEEDLSPWVIAKHGKKGKK